MKRRLIHSLLSSTAAFAVATSFVACEKKTADQPATPPAGNTAAPAAPGKAGEPAKTTEPAKAPEPAKGTAAAPAQPAAAPASVAAIRETYGIAATLTNDVEAFSANYRLHDLWVKLSGSNWAKTLISLPALKDEPKFQQMLQQWKSPQAEKAKEILESVLGTEFAVVFSSGFTEKFLPWVKLATELQSVQLQQAITTGMSGGRPQDPMKLLRDAAPELIPAAVKCDLPPVFLAFKAAKSKADIDGALAKVTGQLGAGLPPGIELGKFTAGKYEFQNIVVDASKLIADPQDAMIRGQLAEILGDEAKAKDALAALKKKKVELAWGWVGDYLVISLGTDHSHVKFAGGDADSALAIPAVARRASEYAGRKPLGLGYASAAMQEKITGKLEFADAFKKVSDELSTLLKPEHIAAMQADVKKFEAKVQALQHTKFDPMVSVSYWEGGIHGESFGGAQLSGISSAKPLAFASLLTPASLVFADSRSNPANSGKLADLIEEGSAMLWSWYEKFGRTMVPEDERQGAAMVEAMALPIVKDVWGSSRKLASALGDESAFILDMNGTMPTFPNLPPNLAEGKVPRVAWVAELKDRAGVSEAWKGFEKIFKQLAALAPGGIPEPVMKKDGDVELHYVEPPLSAGDFLPHIAISKDRWIISSSPSFTKEITSKSPAAGGARLGSEVRLQVPALCDFAEAWLKVVDKDPAFFFRGSGDQKEYAQLRPTFGEIIKLLRSIQSLEVRVSSEGSETRNSMFLKLEDVK